MDIVTIALEAAGAAGVGYYTLNLIFWKSGGVRTARNPHGYTRRRIKNVALRDANKKIRVLYKGELAAKASRTEHISYKKDRNLKASQQWASEFETAAHHTWNGPWEPAEVLPDDGEGYTGIYANKEHWAALTDPQRWAHMREQQASSYENEYDDVTKRNKAIKAADAWRKAGSINHRAAAVAQKALAAKRPVETKAKPDPIKKVKSSKIPEDVIGRVREQQRALHIMEDELRKQRALMQHSRDEKIGLSSRIQELTKAVIAAQKAGKLEVDYTMFMDGIRDRESLDTKFAAMFDLENESRTMSPGEYVITGDGQTLGTESPMFQGYPESGGAPKPDDEDDVTMWRL